MRHYFSVSISALSMLIVVFLFSSCSPRVLSTISKSYTPLPTTSEVKIYELADKAPVHAEYLGEVNVGDNGFSSHCDYATVLELAKVKARAVGGDAIKIKTHRFPDLVSSCHQIVASIYKQSDEPALSQTSANSIETSAKTAPDTIQYRKAGIGYKYTYKNEPLTLVTFKSMLSNNNKVFNSFQRAKGTSIFISILSYSGGYLIGYPIGTMLAGGEPLWPMALVGCGLVAIAIPIATIAENNLLKAVQLYNNGIAPTPKANAMELKMGVNQNGVGLVLRF